MREKIIYILSFALIISPYGCGEYATALKSNNPEERYIYAKKYYEEGKYGRAAGLLETLPTAFRGTAKAEETLFLLAQSYFMDGDYSTANQYFSTYYKTYPRGEYVEQAHFNAAYGMYLSSPDYKLDQTPTYNAISEFQNFLELFPRSTKVELAQQYMFELQEKLAEKELGAVQLYYNLGNYMGNNYQSCIITARNAVRAYPYSKYLEDYQIYILRSTYELAKNSVEYLQPIRYRNVVDECYNYKNSFPEGKYLDEMEKYLYQAETLLQKLPDDNI